MKSFMKNERLSAICAIVSDLLFMWILAVAFADYGICLRTILGFMFYAAVTISGVACLFMKCRRQQKELEELRKENAELFSEYVL